MLIKDKKTKENDRKITTPHIDKNTRKLLLFL